MSQVIIFDPASENVSNKVLSYQRSVPGSEFGGRNDVIIYDTDGDPASVTLLSAVPITRWKVVAGDVIAWDQADIDAQAAADVVTANAQAVAALAALKQEAKDALDAQTDAIYALIVDLALTLMDENNILRALHSLPPRTVTQLKNAIKAKTDAR